MIYLVLILSVALILALISRYRLSQQLETHLTTQDQDLVRIEDQEHALQIDTTWKLLNALQICLFTVSSEGRIQWVNQKTQDLFGGRRLEDRPLEEALFATELITPTREALANKMAVSRQIRLPKGSLSGDFPTYSGESHWIVEVTPVTSTEDPTYYLVALRDITRNVHANQIRKDFVANASHELRTPLTIVSGYLENLLEDELLNEPETARHLLDIMLKHVERINRIVEDMLVISRLESGESSALRIAPFKIEECIQDVLKRLEPLIEKQKAKVRIKVADPELTLEGDRFYWVQVLFNLVENALKQNSTMPVKITVSASSPDQEKLLLEVADNGTGIPSSDLPYIFKRFFRVEKHHSQGEIKGTGLGLSIVKRAVEAHGGTITASSTPGVDTRFSMHVPLTQSHLSQNQE